MKHVTDIRLHCASWLPYATLVLYQLPTCLDLYKMEKCFNYQLKLNTVKNKLTFFSISLEKAGSHVHNTSISINASTSTRKSMCELGRHKCKHKKRNFYLLVLVPVLASLCHICEWDNTSTSTVQEKRKYFLLANEQTNVASPTLTVTQDGNGDRGKTLRLWTSLCLYLHLCLRHMCEPALMPEA